MTTQTLVINTHDLSKSYKTVTALKSLNLKVPKNSIFGFLGPNGAGKTTTIKLLLGLIRPTNGRATLFDLDSTQDSLQIRQRVGYLPQEPHFYDYMTARETLRFTAKFFYPNNGRALEKRVQETLELVGLADKANRPIKGFSGGERQRVGIGQAQVNHPDLLILDEPAANLDPMGRRDVLEVMAKLRQHTTIFYSTHILSDVQRVSDTVAILKEGELIAQAPVEQLLADGTDLSYTVSLKGNTRQVEAKVAEQPWVQDLNITPVNGHIQWQINVTDTAVAEAQLLRLILADEHVTVTHFGRKQSNLEEVFLSMVEGENA